MREAAAVSRSEQLLAAGLRAVDRRDRNAAERFLEQLLHEGDQVHVRELAEALHASMVPA